MSTLGKVDTRPVVHTENGPGKQMKYPNVVTERIAKKDMIAAKRGRKIRNVLSSYLQSNILSRGPSRLAQSSLQFFEIVEAGCIESIADRSIRL